MASAGPPVGNGRPLLDTRVARIGFVRRLVLVVAGAAVVATVASSAQGAGEPPGRVGFVRGVSLPADVYVVGTNGGGLRRITYDRTSTDPAWTTDGRKLVYSSARGGDAELFAARGDGRNVRRLTSNRAEDVLPAWSPDGRRIAFASNRSGAFEIWTVQSDGTGARRVTRGARGDYGSFYPAWSPDGRWIAFASSFRTPENQEIYVVRPDGRQLRRLTRTAGDVDVLGDDAAPTWSPDGSRIVFASNRTGELEIWTMRADGSGQRRLTGIRGSDDSRPKISPDGRWIAFGSLDSRGRSSICLVRTSGKGLRRLVEGTAPAWLP